jgi:glutamate carboxypeptidase
MGLELLGARPEHIEREGRVHLLWDFGGSPSVVLVGHVDTVWPLGTTDRWPFQVRSGRASGPGVFDMKAGIVQLLYAVSWIERRRGIRIVLTCDEELGSPTSRALIEATATGAQAALVIEPSADGALKTARKGVSLYRIGIEGRAAHAGLEPHRGVNATVELAHQVLALGAIARPEVGTTVTPTVAGAGTATNTVPAEAEVRVDVRVADPDEQHRVDRQLMALKPKLPGARLGIEGGPNRPPFPESVSAGLFARARRVATGLGLETLTGAAVGGGSDGNFTAGLGVPTLDGLGAVGGGAHAEGEHVELAAMIDRTSLLAGLVDELLEDAAVRPN